MYGINHSLHSALWEILRDLKQSQIECKFLFYNVGIPKEKEAIEGKEAKNFKWQ